MLSSLNTIPLQFAGFLKTPPLWINPAFFEFPQIGWATTRFQDIDDLDIDIPKRQILGKRAELFFQYYTENFSEEEVLSNNIQIQAGKVTLGEIDFLLKNQKDHAISHVELVYKFYIYDPSFPVEKQRWIGPNRKDTLVEKLLKLKHRQFPLLYKEETKEYLENAGIPIEEIRQKVCFKANLFVPFHLMGRFFPEINNDCIVGYWINSFEFTEKNYGGQHFFSPKKQYWPIEPENNTTWFDFQEIKEQIQPLLDKKKSPLIWMKKNNGKFYRFFVVWW